MTALYAILAIIIIGGILVGVYLVGFDDGVKAERMQRSLYIIGRTVTLDDEKHHTITHADMVQMEVEATNKKKEQQK